MLKCCVWLLLYCFVCFVGLVDGQWCCVCLLLLGWVAIWVVFIAFLGCGVGSVAVVVCCLA